MTALFLQLSIYKSVLKQVSMTRKYHNHRPIQDIVRKRLKTQIQSHDSLFDLFLYVPSTIFHLNRDGSSCAEPVLS